MYSRYNRTREQCTIDKGKWTIEEDNGQWREQWTMEETVDNGENSGQWREQWTMEGNEKQVVGENPTRDTPK